MASLAEKRIDEVEAERMPSEQPVKAVHPASPVELVQTSRDHEAELDEAAEQAEAEAAEALHTDEEFTEAEQAETDEAGQAEVEAELAETEIAAELDPSEADDAALDESAADEGEAEAGIEDAAEIVAAMDAGAARETESEASPEAEAEVASVADVGAQSELGEAAPSLVSPEADDSEQRSTRPEELRLLEALLFASTEPLEQSALAKKMPEGVNIKVALAQLQDDYALRGVNLVRVANKWTFRTAYDLAWLMTRESKETRKLSRAAIEMLAIVAYHQPVTRAEIEDIRGVVTSKGTLDVLLETGWIRPRGRRKTPGRPLTFGTTDTFLSQFNLESLGDLPGLEELKGTGLLDSRLPTGFSVPNPSDDPALREDEDPLEIEDLQLALAPAVEPEEDEPQAGAPEDDGTGSPGE